jgi:serine/threonine-protein kinase RsbW
MFPRESVSIPVMRRILGDILSRLGVEADCASDLLLAATEACTNVMLHAGPGRPCEVVLRVGRHRCVLEVLDTGRGFDPARLRARRVHRRRPPARAVPLPLLGSRVHVRPVTLPVLRRRAPDADPGELPESGRGFEIMRACVDEVSLTSGPGRGTVVQLRKRLEWSNGSALEHSGEPALRDAG